MQTEDMIVLDEFCASHQVEVSFIQLLEEHGLIEIIITNQTLCVPTSELSRLEQIVRLHQELDINLEGIDAINNLLQRIEEMQKEITDLRNKLSFHEEENK
jgi:chaperone modulatory protein CbpM